MWRMVLALTCVSALAATGCWSYTDVLTPAKTGEGQQSYGTSVHTKVAYMVLAAMVQRQTTTAQNASVADGSDAYWRVYDGGSHLEFCHQQGSSAACSEATLDGAELPAGWALTYVIVDPFNLGRMFIETETQGGDQYTYTASGMVVITDARIPATSSRGLWVAGAGLMYCQGGQKGASCRTLELPGEETLFFPSFLGVFVLDGQDVLWLGSGGQVYRCTAGANTPTPTCQLAKMS